MKFADFDKLTEQLFTDVRRMRDSKGREYARSADRFDNFNRLALQLDLDRLKVWAVYFAKHMDAIFSFVNHKRVFSTESIRGRVVDALTYLTLFQGMVSEDEQNARTSKRIPHNVPSVRKHKTRNAIVARNGSKTRTDVRRTRRVRARVAAQ